MTRLRKILITASGTLMLLGFAVTLATDLRNSIGTGSDIGDWIVAGAIGWGLMCLPGSFIPVGIEMHKHHRKLYP